MTHPGNTSGSSHYDVIIAGGGMVGSMLACALAKQTQLRVAVLEVRLPESFEPGSNPPYDLRVSALSVASQHMFEKVGAWQGIVDRRACPYTDMVVWDGERRGQTNFCSKDIGAPALGHIAENRVIQLALLDQLQQSSQVTLLCPASLASFRQEKNQVRVILASGEQLTASLLVGADGARSAVRNGASISVSSSVYPQHALVASVDTQLPQQAVTWQRFMPTGPQAFLPLCGSRASLVWYHSEDEVVRLLKLDDKEFIAELESAFPERLGRVESVQARGSFPITKAHAERYVEPRVALTGDAAHTVHPLAGQGVNLGLLDAAVLAEIIENTVHAGKDIGELRQLRRYERWRRSENVLMVNALDGFYHAFKPQPVPFQVLRSSSLDLVDRIHPLKTILMRHAMGVSGKLPALARI